MNNNNGKLILVFSLAGVLLLSCSSAPKGSGGTHSAGGSNLKLKMGLTAPSSLKLKLKSAIRSYRYLSKGRKLPVLASTLSKSRALTKGISDSGAYLEIQNMVSNTILNEGNAAIDLVIALSSVSNLNTSLTDVTDLYIDYNQQFVNNVIGVVPDSEGIDTDYLTYLRDNIVWEQVPPFTYKSLAGDTNYDYEFSYDPDTNWWYPFTGSWSSDFKKVKADYSGTNGDGLTNGYIFTYDDTRKAAKMLYLEQFYDSYSSQIDQYLQNLSMKQDTGSTIHGVWVAYTEKYSDSQEKYSYQTVGYADDLGGYLTTVFVYSETGVTNYNYLYQEGFNSSGTIYAAESDDGGISWTFPDPYLTNTNQTYISKYNEYSNQAAADNSDNTLVQDVYNTIYSYLVEPSAQIDYSYYVYTNPVAASDILAYNDWLTNESASYPGQVDAGYIGEAYCIDNGGILELEFIDRKLTNGSTLYLYNYTNNWDSPDWGAMDTNGIINTNYGYGLPDEYKSMRSIISKSVNKPSGRIVSKPFRRTRK
jgi:hypothetical protein